ncbi:MAG: hypothetical protein AAGC45_06740 [Bacteroidota bacterium]
MTGLALLFDTGCFVLIWLVQLVIYPSFQHYRPTEFKIWHSRYTKRVTYVVLPLMLGQLVLGTIQATSFDVLPVFKLIFILATWLVTFVFFVPLHNKMDKTEEIQDGTKALVKQNWVRTGLWSLIFVISVVQYFTI